MSRVFKKEKAIDWKNINHLIAMTEPEMGLTNDDLRDILNAILRRMKDTENFISSMNMAMPD
jgi:hypothetical protein